MLSTVSFGSVPRAIFMILLALTIGRIFQSPCMRRLFRNAALPGIPEPLAPVYAKCSDADLSNAVSLVVTVKDTCAQAEELLTHLSKFYPKDMHVYYVYPAIRGCRHVAVGATGRKLFTNFTEVSIGIRDAPIAGFLKVQPLLTTKYAMLMHNDAYPMERDFACELFRALDANPRYPIAAPQIYEAGSDGLIVPHGHHQNLHIRPSNSGKGDRIDYDLSMNLLTQRKPEDFHEGPQVNFLEDHAFLARTDKYPELLDESGSFTMEYMDMILNMRARNTSAWYVPTARCIFDVDTNKITWEDLPYLVYKRSEQVGHQVRTYLTKKWGVEFVNSGIWNYVRYVMLANVVLEGNTLPTAWEDQAAVFYSWFESVGFNRYNGQMLPEFIEEPGHGIIVNISRTMMQTLPTDVPSHRVPPKPATAILPKQQRKKMGAIDISFRDPHIPIGVKTRSCTASEPSSYKLCGLVVQDGNECKCWNYVVPFNLQTTLGLDKVMQWLKLPSRAFMYGQMKYWTKEIDEDSVDMFCSRDEEECTFQVHFSPNARILQWSWFGKVPKYPVTPEGAAIGAIFLSLLIALFAVNSNRFWRWLAIRKGEFRSLVAINMAICSHTVRS